VITAERGAGANYLIADENGECYDIETTARSFNYFYIDKSFGHANHYLTRTSDQRDIAPRKTDANTIVRCNRMNKLLEKEFGKMSVDTCFGLLKDHVNYPTSICVHPNPDLPPEMAMKTMDSIVISPAKREMHVTRDNPCKTDFKKYSLQ
jgi:isopenicillin-N N-acyltransferase-like protein